MRSRLNHAPTLHRLRRAAPEIPHCQILARFRWGWWVAQSRQAGREICVPELVAIVEFEAHGVGVALVGSQGRLRGVLHFLHVGVYLVLVNKYAREAKPPMQDISALVPLRLVLDE